MLNERYEFHKMFALHWLEMKKKYNNSSIAMLSKVLDNTPFNVEQIKADIFQEDLDMEGKRCFSKLKRDILAD